MAIIYFVHHDEAELTRRNSVIDKSSFLYVCDFYGWLGLFSELIWYVKLLVCVFILFFICVAEPLTVYARRQTAKKKGKEKVVQEAFTCLPVESKWCVIFVWEWTFSDFYAEFISKAFNVKWSSLDIEAFVSALSYY